MTIDKFGRHISQKYTNKGGYQLCYIPIHVHDYAQTFGTVDFKTVLSYKINEITNTWHYPLIQTAVVQRCNVFKPSIKFIINDTIVDTLEGETLSKGDVILVIRSTDTPITGDGIIELILKIPITYNEYE